MNKELFRHLQTLKVQDKLAVLTIPKEVPKWNTEELHEMLRDLGALGLVALQPGQAIQMLGVKELEEILNHMKEVTKSEEPNKKVDRKESSETS